MDVPIMQRRIVQGVKYDQGKPRPSLIPWDALWEVLKVLEAGAKKYAPDNWKIVPDAEERYREAIGRHYKDLMCGVTKDKDDGLHPAAHIACCCLFLLWFAIRKPSVERTIKMDEFGYPENER